jgi:HPt (histidine-containing phosphotransfer) domain-containing protein
MPELAAILEYIGQERQRNNRIVSLTRQTTSAEDKEEPVATSMVVSFPILEQLLLLVSGDDPTEARDFITHYLQHIAESQAALCQAFEQGDIETLTRIAHSLKGVSAQFGALNLSLYYKQLEQMGKQNSLQGAAELIDQAAAEYKRVQKTLQSWYPQGEQSKTSGKTNGDGSA